MNNTNEEMKLWKVQFPYTVTQVFTADEGNTKITIQTTSEEVLFSKSLEDARSQKLFSDTVSGESYKSHILNYVREQLSYEDGSTAKLEYTDEPLISLMTDEELYDFQRDIISIGNKNY